MEGNYEVRLGQTPIGKAQVLRQGLYYRVTCHCRLTGEVMYRLIIHCGGHDESLGVLIPMGGSFGLETKLPVKKVGEGKLDFFVLPKHPQKEGKFVPIYPEEPFSYISRLKDAHLEVRNGQTGVVIPE